MTAEHARALLQERIGRIENYLEEVFACHLPALDPQGWYMATGIGASEGPARYMAALLRTSLGIRARFAPLSSFAMTTPYNDNAHLVVFSQGLCPNARMALKRAGSFKQTLLFTSVNGSSVPPKAISCLKAFSGEHNHVIQLPPPDESGLPLRVMGPALATLAVARYSPYFSENMRELRSVLSTAASRAKKALESIPLERLVGRVAFITSGDYGKFCQGICWKWLEGLSTSPFASPIWDVLQIAHGPFQRFYKHELLLIALEHDNHPVEQEMLDRLASMLVAGRHWLIRLKSQLPEHLAFFDHDAQCNHLLLEALRISDSHLGSWPARGLDEPLYGWEGE